MYGKLSPDIIQQGLVKRALDHLSEKDLELNYSNPYGSPGLRTAIQSYLKGKGIEVPISNILITSRERYRRFTLYPLRGWYLRNPGFMWKAPPIWNL